MFVCMHLLIYLYCFVAPAHYLASSNVCDRCWHFSPLKIIKNLINDFIMRSDKHCTWTNKIKLNYLKHNILGYTADSIHIDAFIVIAQ